MYKFLLGLVLILCLAACKGNESSTETALEEGHGRAGLQQDSIVYHKNFESDFVDDRNVEVWLPKGYPKKNVAYQVLYMNDGQNVLNASTSYSGIAWEVDEKIDSLNQLGAIRPTIVVAVWNNGKKRFNEYMPQFPKSATESAFAKAELKEYSGFDALYSDQYLKFLVEELRPFIKKNYQVSEAPEHTAIMGASMGAHISLYAMMEYPEVFGKAGCFSTHWPIPTLGEPFMAALPEAIPKAETHKIYFDHGTRTLDEVYEPYQLRVNQMFYDQGYDDANLRYIMYETHEHSEKYWQRRVQNALVFLLE